MTRLESIVLIGLLSAVIMFAGDMTLYYDKADYVGDGTLNPIISIMKKESRNRLYLGGMIGPVCAWIYCIGYYHMVLMMDEQHKTAGWILFLLNCLGIILGGAYHSHCANLGLIGRLEHQPAMEEVLRYMNVQQKLSFTIQGLCFAGLLIAIAAGWTILPNWCCIFTPGVLFLLLPLVRKLPKGFHMIICGGWTNIVSILYYLIIFVVIRMEL